MHLNFSLSKPKRSVKLISDRYEIPQTKLMGAGGRPVFSFETPLFEIGEKESFTLAFVYQRDFENCAQPTQTVEIKCSSFSTQTLAKLLELYSQYFLPNCQVLAKRVNCDTYLKNIQEQIITEAQTLQVAKQQHYFIKHQPVSIANKKYEMNAYAAVLLYKNIFNENLIPQLKDKKRKTEFAKQLQNNSNWYWNYFIQQKLTKKEK